VSDSPIIIAGEPREPEVAVVMHRCGKIIPLTPRYFSVYSSHEEAVDRARIWLRLNPAFARKWAGWKIASLRVDNQVEIPE